MSNSTTWMNKKSKTSSSKTKNITTPSNLKHLPLETYMIPIENRNSKSEEDSKNASKKSEKTVLFEIMSKVMILIKKISNLAAFIDAKETQLSKFVAQSFSNKKNTNDDVLNIKENLIIFLNALLSIIVVYNLYFGMFFKDLKGNRINQFSFSLGELKNNNGILHFVFKYILCTLSMLIETIKNLIPKYIEQYISIDVVIDRRAHFILLFIVVNLIITFLGNIILNSATDTTFIGIYSVIFLLYAIYQMLLDFRPLFPIFIPIIDMPPIMMKYQSMGTYTPIMIFILFCIRYLFSISFIPLTALLNCLYLMYISFLLILIFYFYSNVKAINEFIGRPTQESGEKKPTSPLSILIMDYQHGMSTIYPIGR